MPGSEAPLCVWWFLPCRFQQFLSFSLPKDVLGCLLCLPRALQVPSCFPRLADVSPSVSEHTSLVRAFPTVTRSPSGCQWCSLGPSSKNLS